MTNMLKKVERREFLNFLGAAFGSVGLAAMAESVHVLAETGKQELGNQKDRKMAVKYILRRITEVPKERSTCGYRQRMITNADCDKACFTFLSVHEAGRHHHNKTTEFYYVLKGKGILELDEDRVEVEPGTVIMIPPGIRHKAVGEIEALIVGIPSLDPADFFLD